MTTVKFDYRLVDGVHVTGSNKSIILADISNGNDLFHCSSPASDWTITFILYRALYATLLQIHSVI